MTVRPRQRVVKITDVAELAGVAPMTVSRVINAPERVAPETAARVRQAIATLGYVPNLIAGGLSSRRSRMIAAVVPTIDSPMFAQTVRGFSEVCERAGYQVLLAISGYGQYDEEALTRSLLSRRPDGLVLTGVIHRPGVRKLLKDSNVPLVELWDTAKRPIDMLVGFDHAEAGAMVARHFLAQGHSHFATFAAQDIRAEARQLGFKAAMHAGGASQVGAYSLIPPGNTADGRRLMREVLRQLPARLALFCSSDSVAFGAATEALAHHVKVPQQLAICGFGDFELAAATEPSLTSISVNGELIGRQAAELLLARIQNQAPRSRRRITVPLQLIARASG